MRHSLLALLLITTVTVPAAGQSGDTIDRRVQKIEKELRAVQRKVFPGGAGMTVEPEISPDQGSAIASGVPASNATADLTARIDSLEKQLRSLTGQAEENAHRLGQLEQALARLRGETENRLNAVERPVPGPGTSSSEAALPVPPSPEPAAASADPGEEAYLAGYRLWNSGKFNEAQTALEAMVKQYPKHPRASYAQNLLGRAYLDGGKPATAAKVLLANYESNKSGERAPDSLYYLGQALVRLDRLPAACKVYDELQDVYGANLRSGLRQQLDRARTEAKCS